MDVFNKQKRSEIMSHIRSKNTKAEVLVFRYLNRKDIYFQKHYKKAAGSPDIALPRKKIAIFIDGDFWHGYRFNSFKDRLPKRYWLEKIESNIRRDKCNRKLLHKEGWKVLRIWEHELEKKKIDTTLTKVIEFLNRD